MALSVEGKPLMQKYWAMAATVLLFVSLGIWGGLKYQETWQAEKLFNENYTLDSEDFAYRGLPTEGKAENINELLEAIRSIKRNNFNEAIGTLNRIPDKNTSIYLKKYYLGISYLAKSKTELAIENLKIACYTKESPLMYKAQWYLALAYLKNKEKQKAKKILENLLEINNPFKQKAKELYVKL